MKSEKAKEYLKPDDPEMVAIITEKCFMPIKSEKARLYVLNNINASRTLIDTIFAAIAIAEEEAEERVYKEMRERAVEAFDKMLDWMVDCYIGTIDITTTNCKAVFLRALDQL